MTSATVARFDCARYINLKFLFSLFFPRKKKRGKSAQPLDYSISKLFQGTDTDDNDRTVNTVNIDLHVIGVKNIPSFLLSVERLLVVLIDELSRNKKRKKRKNKNGRRRKMDG